MVFGLDPFHARIIPISRLGSVISGEGEREREERKEREGRKQTGVGGGEAAAAAVLLHTQDRRLT